MRILLFGIARDIAGAPVINISEPLATVTELKHWLYSRYPAMQQLRSLAVAVNRVYAQESAALQPGDEVAVIPPVSGG